MKQTRRFPKADVLRHAVRTLALMVLSVAAFAQTSPPVAAVNTAPKNKPTPILFKGTDITDFVEYSKLDVMTVTRSFKLYNWSKNGQNAQWKQIPNSHDARTLNMVKRSANGYFGQLGNPGGDENMYGYGLYTSLDPVATRSYGGYSYSYGYEKPVDPNAQQMWQLIELTTPIGFKFLDLNQAHNYSRSDVDLQPTLNAFKCTGLRSADSFFQYGAVRLAPECIALFKFVFQDTLKIDAFSYSYNTSHFLMCDKGLYAVNERSFDRERALVLTSNTWMNTQNVSVRVSIMRGEPNERRLIQSLFAYSGYAQNGGMVLDPKAAQSVIKNLLSQNPTASIQDGGTKCSGLQCLMTIYACPNGVKFNDSGANCTDQTIRLPSPAAPVFHAADMNEFGLMWPDLEGQPMSSSKEVEAWLNQNRLGCDGTAAYTPIPTSATATKNSYY